MGIENVTMYRNLIIKSRNQTYIKNMNNQFCTKEEWDRIKKEIDLFYTQFNDESIYQENKKIDKQSDATLNKARHSDCKSKDNRPKGIVYFIKAGENYKIGVTSKNLDDRIKTLQTGNAFPIEVIAHWVSRNYNELEKKLHNRFKDKALVGEWFSFNKSEVQEVIEASNSIIEGWSDK